MTLATTDLIELLDAAVQRMPETTAIDRDLRDAVREAARRLLAATPMGQQALERIRDAALRAQQARPTHVDFNRGEVVMSATGLRFMAGTDYLLVEAGPVRDALRLLGSRA